MWRYFIMTWIIGEIKTEMDLGRTEKILTRIEIKNEILSKDIKLFTCWGSDGKYLGEGISDEDCRKLYALG